MNEAPLVMVVDDDTDLRQAVADVLEAKGYRVETAENGAAALELLNDSDELPRVILLDMMMPVMDGWAFCAEKSRLPRIAGVPVIVFSAHADSHQVARDLHAVASLTKPLRAQQLVDMVAMHTG
jgi:two-component system, chemotaxis family, chemotaxis protein CheY